MDGVGFFDLTKMIHFFSYHSPAPSNVMGFFERLKVRLYLGRIIRFGGNFIIGPLQLLLASLGTPQVGRQLLKIASMNVNYCHALKPLVMAA